MVHRLFVAMVGVVIGGSMVGGTTVATAAVPKTTSSKGPRDWLWSALYDGPGSHSDEAHAVTVSPDGSQVYVTGSSPGASSANDYATVAYDASTGAELWTSRYNGSGNSDDVARSLGVSPDGSRIYVTGSSFGSSSAYDYATVAYDASTGAELWTSRYNGPGNSDDLAYALGVRSDGSRVYVTGGSDGVFADSDYATVAYDASTGAQLWTARYNPANGGDVAYALAVSPDGSRVYVTGSSPQVVTSDDYATVAYDASTGTELWTARYDGPDSSNDYADALGVSPDGARVYVTGYSWSTASSSFDYATVGYDASTGAGLWKARYNGSGSSDDLPTALGVSPDGARVYVTGYSWGGGSSWDYATVAYDTSIGARAWGYRELGRGNDLAYGLGVSPDGSRVYVTGHHDVTLSGPSDYGTIAYAG